MDLSRPAAGLRTRRLSRGLSRRPSGWLGSQLLRHTTLDGVRPAAIADFESWRFAIPALGPEVLTNGDFANGSDSWAIQGENGTTHTLTFSGGTVRYQSTTTSPVLSLLYENILELGKLYRIEIVISAYTSGSIKTDSINGGNVNFPSSVGTHYIYGVATQNTLGILRATTNVDLTIDSVSVKEVMIGEFGPELVTNGQFSGSNISGWTSGSGGLLSPQNLRLRVTIDAADTFGNAYQEIPVEAGKSYFVYINIAVINATSSPTGIAPTATGTRDFLDFSTGSPGPRFAEFTATSSGTVYFQLGASGAAGTYVEFDNVSVREATKSPTLRECSFSEWFAYTASSTTARTYTSSSGTLANDLSADQPRRDFSLGASRLLLENAATNLLFQSNTFSTSWSNSNSTETANAAISPDGTLNAWKLTEDTPNAIHDVRQSLTFAASTPHTFSVHVKAAERTWVHMWTGGTGVASSGIYFNLATGTFGTIQSNVLAYSAKYLGNGWYRVSVTANSASSGNTTYSIAIGSADNTVIYPGTPGSGLYIYGAQMEAASFPSAYIPTTTGSVTRAIETARFAPLLEAIMQRPAATIVVRGVQKGPSTGRIVGIDGTNSLLSLSSTSVLLAYNGTNFLFKTVGSNWPYSPFGVGIAFDSSGRSITGNSLTPESDANAAGTRSTIYLARSATVGTSYGDGLYTSVVIYPTRLSNAALQYVARA